MFSLHFLGLAASQDEPDLLQVNPSLFFSVPFFSFFSLLSVFHFTPI